MEIKKYIGGFIQSNGYIIYRKDCTEAFIIDPGYKPERFLDFAADNNLEISGVLLTHHHKDHIGAVKTIIDKLGCTAFIHEADAHYCSFPVTTFEDGHVFMLGEEKITAVNTPGHTKGSCCFCAEGGDHFTGDTLFDTDIGRTDLEDGDPWGMAAALQNIVNKWPDEIRVHPGHGDSSTMAKVRKYNPEFIEALELDLDKHNR
jgi:Zn-dependent hydrolases, including glyoxylases